VSGITGPAFLFDGRGARDDTMAHFLPTKFDRRAAALVASPAGADRPVVCSEPLVETTMIEAKTGTVIPLVNWSAGPIKGLTVTVNVAVPAATAALASGNPVTVARRGRRAVFTLDLDVADALVLR
jgi:hypothetical protein